VDESVDALKKILVDILPHIRCVPLLPLVIARLS
jgi:hypothetical protein